MNEAHNWQKLGNAVIEQAVTDFRSAHRIRHNPNSSKQAIDKAKHALREIRKFFRSDYFGLLSMTCGKRLLKKLESEVTT